MRKLVYLLKESQLDFQEMFYTIMIRRQWKINFHILFTWEGEEKLIICCLQETTAIHSIVQDSILEAKQTEAK